MALSMLKGDCHMHTSSTLEVMGDSATMVDLRGQDSTCRPNRAPHWWRFSKLGLALAFLAAAYFFHEQVWTSTSLEATLARFEQVISETTAELNRGQAVMERTQHELTRAKTLAANDLIAQATLDDTVLASQQARFEVERLTASLKRLNVERTGAKNG